MLRRADARQQRAFVLVGRRKRMETARDVDPAGGATSAPAADRRVGNAGAAAHLQQGRAGFGARHPPVGVGDADRPSLPRLERTHRPPDDQRRQRRADRGGRESLHVLAPFGPLRFPDAVSVPAGRRPSRGPPPPAPARPCRRPRSPRARGPAGAAPPRRRTAIRAGTMAGGAARNASRCSHASRQRPSTRSASRDRSRSPTGRTGSSGSRSKRTASPSVPSTCPKSRKGMASPSSCCAASQAGILKLRPRNKRAIERVP